MTTLLHDDRAGAPLPDTDWRECGIAAALQINGRMGAPGDAVLRAIRRHRPGLATLGAEQGLERAHVLRFLATLPGGTRSLLAGEAALQDGAVTVPHFAWLAATWGGHPIEIVLPPGGARGGILYCGPDAAGLHRLARAIDDHAVRPPGRALRYAGDWRAAPDLDRALGAVTWDDLVLPPALLAGLRQAVEGFAASRATFRALGFPWRRGILLVGPPGTDKTMACKAAAAALPDYPFLYVRDLREGHGRDVLHTVFARARRLAPCILAFEDLDGLVGTWNRTVFLNELDGFARNDGLLLIASSNHPEQIDPALLKRPARFDRVFHLGLPGADECRAFCALVLGRLAAADRLAPDLAIAPLAARVAAATAGFTPAYLQEAFTGAAAAPSDFARDAAGARRCAVPACARPDPAARSPFGGRATRIIPHHADPGHGPVRDPSRTLTAPSAGADEAAPAGAPAAATAIPRRSRRRTATTLDEAPCREARSVPTSRPAPPPGCRLFRGAVRRHRAELSGPPRIARGTARDRPAVLLAGCAHAARSRRVKGGDMMLPAGWPNTAAASFGSLLVLALLLGACATGGATTARPTPTGTLVPDWVEVGGAPAAPTVTPTAARATPATASSSRGVGPTPTVDCPPLAAPSVMPYPGWAGLIWYSDTIVVGTVLAQDTRWEGRAIVTASLVRVDERVRGLPAATLTVDQTGGTLGGCTQRGSERPLPRDMRVLLFLGRLAPRATDADGAPYFLKWGGYGGADRPADTSVPTAERLADVRRILRPECRRSRFGAIPFASDHERHRGYLVPSGIHAVGHNLRAGGYGTTQTTRDDTELRPPLPATMLPSRAVGAEQALGNAGVLMIPLEASARTISVSGRVPSPYPIVPLRERNKRVVVILPAGRRGDAGSLQPAHTKSRAALGGPPPGGACCARRDALHPTGAPPCGVRRSDAGRAAPARGRGCREYSRGTAASTGFTGEPFYLTLDSRITRSSRFARDRSGPDAARRWRLGAGSLT